jgi:hypothetical protein
MAEPKRITVDDVVEILVKHATAPNDPDDAEALTRFNEQVKEDREKAATAPTPQKGKPSA